MKKRIISLLILFVVGKEIIFAQQIKVDYVNSFGNVNHPQVAYWFFSSNMMDEDRWKGKIDSFVKFSKYTLIFLTERDGCNFYDITTMHPVFSKLVGYAHSRGLKIGLQIWKRDFGTRLENTDRLIQEGEVMLDENGHAEYSVEAKGARNMSGLIKSELFKIYAFKKTTDGFYDPATLKDITALAKADTSRSKVEVSIHAGAQLKNYTAYILTQHYYNYCSNFSAQAKSMLLNAFKAYADIPFDGIGLDEYKNLLIARSPVLKTNGEKFRERLYSPAMAEKMKLSSGMNLDRTLFDMRYAPAGKPETRIKAINEYMSLLRTATLDIERSMYELGKRMYGKNTFIGLHDTFHNNLDGDEVWQTGVSWWNIRRDYGHTDEETPTPIQVGIGMSYPENVMYNMYYNPSLEKIWIKALYDLRFGIRTHYHAANDGQRWGVSIELPEALEKINPVENAARLLNRFNPKFPAIKLLVVYGMEALYNWYPDTSARGLYDVNEKLQMDKKSMLLWENGYLNAAVPTDEIEDGRLRLNGNGKPELNGYVFDAVVFIGPQYSKPVTIKFLNDYVDKGGRLLIDGKADRDYTGTILGTAWKNMVSKATATTFSLENVRKLGIEKNELEDGVSTGEGEFVFTNSQSLKTGTPATFHFVYKGNSFSGKYKGMAAIRVNEKGDLEKLAASKFSGFERNGEEILHMSDEADVFISNENRIMKVTIADEAKATTILAVKRKKRN